ncbi:hypothetical protein RhiirA4_456183 [Rhizophagus irregularis]|uniref:Uncharacterized protein n=1 Tax=Rhizophagus irregularis TaxID=588596 RepID=A0A2I1G6X1_9GLOM|nr:hypothetical protein RhiirA4_456183 [Rhizophagus irregularis]
MDLLGEFHKRCQPEDLCQANDTFKVYITTCDCLSLIYVLIRIAISRTSSRGGLEADLLDVLRENDNPENPVPPVVDKIVEGNKNINRGTDEITIPRLDEDSAPHESNISSEIRLDSDSIRTFDSTSKNNQFR